MYGSYILFSRLFNIYMMLVSYYRLSLYIYIYIYIPLNSSGKSVNLFLVYICFKFCFNVYYMNYKTVLSSRMLIYIFFNV